MATAILDDVGVGPEDEATLAERMRPLYRVEGVRNLLYLAGDYVALLAIAGGAIAFAELRAGWGLGWGWNVPVFALAIVLMGGVQHRLAAMAHEASHYTFLRNRVLNDLIPDLFCLMPLFSCVHLYRYYHMAHHQFVNDPEHDPDWQYMERYWGGPDAPRSRWGFIRDTYLRLFIAPRAVLRFIYDYTGRSVLALGEVVYSKKMPGYPRFTIRPATWAAIGYLLAVDVAMIALERTGRTAWIFPLAALATLATVPVVSLLPEGSYFRSPFKQVYSSKTCGVMRLGFFTFLLAALNVLRDVTGGASTRYFFLLWVVPSMTTFMYYMLLREIYQHANTEEDRITNSRVFRCDLFTRWAILVHGQDWHVPHHMFPAVPHYNLPALHALLKAHDDEYRERVIEVDGTFKSHRDDRPALLDVVTSPVQN